MSEISPIEGEEVSRLFVVLHTEVAKKALSNFSQYSTVVQQAKLCRGQSQSHQVLGVDKGKAGFDNQENYFTFFKR